MPNALFFILADVAADQPVQPEELESDYFTIWMGAGLSLCALALLLLYWRKRRAAKEPEEEPAP